MQTECTAKQFDFGIVEGREVVAAFDAGLVTSDAGGLLLGATERAIDLIARFAGCFRDRRRPELIEHEVVTLVGQRVFAIALGYEDLNDHDDLRHDPVMATLAGKLSARRLDCAPVAGKSTLNRLELSRPAPSRYHKIAYDESAIEDLAVDVFLEAHKRVPKQIILDLDATDDPLHGHQEDRFFHGYYDCYCYLPLYVFCGRHLLASKLRPANIDASAGSVEVVARVVEQIRRRWPYVRIMLRADSGFAREALMAWCESNHVDYVFGLARNARLVTKIAAELAAAQAAAEVAEAEAQNEANGRWESALRKWKGWLADGDPTHKAEAEIQLDLYADRTSAATMRANQLRLWFASMAYILLCALRRIGLAETIFADATCGTIRLKLLKIGALVRISVRRIKFAMASACPAADIWGRAASKLVAAAKARASPA